MLEIIILLHSILLQIYCLCSICMFYFICFIHIRHIDRENRDRITFPVEIRLDLFNIRLDKCISRLYRGCILLLSVEGVGLISRVGFESILVLSLLLVRDDHSTQNRIKFEKFRENRFFLSLLVMVSTCLSNYERVRRKIKQSKRYDPSLHNTKENNRL